MHIKPSAKVVGVAIAGTAAAFLVARGFRKHSPNTSDDDADEAATYPPLDTLKPIAENVWIVDSGPIRPGGVPLPVRMTVLRLENGDLLLHSPTGLTEALVAALQALGPVRHLVAPNIAHWTFLKDWQQRFPDAVTWAAPGLRDRGQVQASGLRLDRDLSEQAPPEWSAEIEQGIIQGAGYVEVYFFHRPSRTLILTDVIQHMHSARLPAVTRAFVLLSGAHAGTTPRYLRTVLRLRHRAATRAFEAMLKLAPERVIFAHGAWFERDGANRLRRALEWLTG